MKIVMEKLEQLQKTAVHLPPEFLLPFLDKISFIQC